MYCIVFYYCIRIVMLFDIFSNGFYSYFWYRITNLYIYAYIYRPTKNQRCEVCYVGLRRACLPVFSTAIAAILKSYISTVLLILVLKCKYLQLISGYFIILSYHRAMYCILIL